MLLTLVPYSLRRAVSDADADRGKAGLKLPVPARQLTTRHLALASMSSAGVDRASGINLIGRDAPQGHGFLATVAVGFQHGILGDNEPGQDRATLGGKLFVRVGLGQQACDQRGVRAGLAYADAGVEGSLAPVGSGTSAPGWPPVAAPRPPGYAAVARRRSEPPPGPRAAPAYSGLELFRSLSIPGNGGGLRACRRLSSGGRNDVAPLEAGPRLLAAADEAEFYDGGWLVCAGPTRLRSCLPRSTAIANDALRSSKHRGAID
jgi:hypothetical protein